MSGLGVAPSAFAPSLGSLHEPLDLSTGDLDALNGGVFFKFTDNANGSPDIGGGYDALGWQQDVPGQKTQFASLGSKDMLCIRLNDGGGWTPWRWFWHDGFGLGAGVKWRSYSRGFGTVYQNTSETPKQVNIAVSGSGTSWLHCSHDNVVFPIVSRVHGVNATHSAIIPSGHYYQITKSGSVSAVEWMEL